jgi:hypothetical protein
LFPGVTELLLISFSSTLEKICTVVEFNYKKHESGAGTVKENLTTEWSSKDSVTVSDVGQEGEEKAIHLF